MPGSIQGLQPILADLSDAAATDLNAHARLVAAGIGADQYAEIVYDRDTGPDGSWVGVATRTQGSSNGSGYLAIVYGGQVQLYRTDYTGGLNFTLLAQASAATGVTRHDRCPRHDQADDATADDKHLDAISRAQRKN